MSAVVAFHLVDRENHDLDFSPEPPPRAFMGPGAGFKSASSSSKFPSAGSFSTFSPEEEAALVIQRAAMPRLIAPDRIGACTRNGGVPRTHARQHTPCEDVREQQCGAP